MSKIKVSPSLLSADFSKLKDDIKRAEIAGADMFHVDIMDGHFVPNITIGPFIVCAASRCTKLPLMTHLMIENPENFVEDFAKAGSDTIIFHIETVKNPMSIIRKIKRFGKKAGVSIKPKTKVASIRKILPFVSEVLVMTVEPGFGGQKFMPGPLSKIREIRKLYKGDIAIDGGMNYDTAKLAIREGANIIAAGSYLFGGKNMKKLIKEIKGIK